MYKCNRSIKVEGFGDMRLMAGRDIVTPGDLAIRLNPTEGSILQKWATAGNP